MNWEAGADYFRQWLEEQRAKPVEPDQVRLACPECGRGIVRWYGRHQKKHMIYHASAGDCVRRPIVFRGDTPEEALENFRQVIL